MSVEVKLTEKPRRFEVYVGDRMIGEVVSYWCKEDDDHTESYSASRYADDPGELENIGYFDTLKEAATAVVSYDYGDTPIDEIIKRRV